MARLWNTPLFILATVYFVVDGVFSHVTRPITVWIAKKKLFDRMRLWATSLGPYPSLALFAVPVIILEPAKPLAGYCWEPVISSLVPSRSLPPKFWRIPLQCRSRPPWRSK